MVRRSSVGAVKTLTLSQAATAMDLKHDVVRDLVRLRLLPASRGVLKQRSSWLVLEADWPPFEGDTWRSLS